MASEENERDDETSSDESGTDEGSEETSGGAADEQSPDESGQTEGSDDGSGEGEAASAPASSTPSAAEAPKKPSRLSAGARVAAAKAAKAAKKAVKKASIAAEAEAASGARASAAPTPDEAPIEQLKASAVGQAASRAGEWASANQALTYGLAAALVLGMAGYAGWSWYAESQAQAAGALLAEAVEIASAEIEAEDDDAEEADESESDESEERTFETTSARAEAALTAYRRVLSEYPSSRAAAWARLGEARALAETGDAEGARASYATAIRDHGDDALVALRAYEGAAFTYEAEEDWEHAREEYESIEGLEDGAYHIVGAYHLARLRIATGDRVGAQTALEELIEQIETATEGPESPFPYVLAQAQARLRELDPSSASGSDAPVTIGGPGGGGIPEGISPEVLEALRRAMAEGGGGAPE